MTTQWLDNVFWHALTGAQESLAVGEGAARRYAPGYSPIAAFADAAHPDFDALAPYCEPGEAIYCVGWSGPAPAGWRIEAEAPLVRMVWRAGAPPEDPGLDARPLGPAQAAAAMALAAVTHPGPFGPRTIEMGEYAGCVDGTRLIAMAGERSHAGSLREISGVCTHPDFQGRGFAKRLMCLLARRELERGETPFLNVLAANERARSLYRRMGFAEYSEERVRIFMRE